MLAFRFSCWLQRKPPLSAFSGESSKKCPKLFNECVGSCPRTVALESLQLLSLPRFGLTFFLSGACLTATEGSGKGAALFSFLLKLDHCVVKGTESRQSRAVTSEYWRQSEFVGYISGTTKLAAPWKTNSMFKHQDCWGTKWINTYSICCLVYRQTAVVLSGTVCCSSGTPCHGKLVIQTSFKSNSTNSCVEILWELWNRKIIFLAQEGPALSALEGKAFCPAISWAHCCNSYLGMGIEGRYQVRCPCLLSMVILTCSSAPAITQVVSRRTKSIP